jgi:hypothetical protein
MREELSVLRVCAGTAWHAWNGTLTHAFTMGAVGLAALVANAVSSYHADDEEVPGVPDSEARKKCLARQYSGHDALPADCKFPSQLMGPWLTCIRSRSSDPPIWGTRPSDSTPRPS